TGSHIGHGVEPQFAMNIALAALTVERGALFPSHDPSERAMTGALSQAIVTGVSHWRGEGPGLVEAAGCVRRVGARRGIWLPFRSSERKSYGQTERTEKV